MHLKWEAVSIRLIDFEVLLSPPFPSWIFRVRFTHTRGTTMLWQQAKGGILHIYPCLQGEGFSTLPKSGDASMRVSI
jgi:hypothetical protein